MNNITKEELINYEVRGTKLYKNMSKFDMVGIAEGFVEPNDEIEVKTAWQKLVDTDLCWKLQGWFGRTAKTLIEEGLIKPKSASVNL